MECRSDDTPDARQRDESQRRAEHLGHTAREPSRPSLPVRVVVDEVEDQSEVREPKAARRRLMEAFREA